VDPRVPASPEPRSPASRARFDADVTGIASLAEPTRRALYLYVQAQASAVSRDEAAAGVGVPRHVAKFHLDKLVGDGLLEAEYRRRSGRQGPGAGRPAKLYRRAARELAVTLPDRRYALAGQLMARAITESGSDGRAVAEALGGAARDRGRWLGDEARRRAGARAFGRAGVTPSDIDCCQLYDAFTSMVLLTLEGLGFCAKGDGGGFVADGRLRVGGGLPTNTDGGGLSACHPGMRGMFLLVEAVRQLRGEAGARQVDDAELCCVNGTGGWFSSASTAILGVD